ncbi:MAG: ANTAR domain-containing protein [Oscillospiraceae bacterium]|nr:ANTAR domain-containing protein [Oscillospiraceae bacterium]
MIRKRSPPVYTMNALIICTNDDMTAALRHILGSVGVADVTVSDSTDVRKTAVRSSFDIILSVLPFANEFGLDTCVYISSKCCSEQIIFAPSKIYDEVCSKTVGLGLTILPKNSASSLAANIIGRMVALKKDMDEARRKNDELIRKIDEDKLIYRAKCVLIEYLKVTENDAHRILQKRAMDRQIPLYDAALEVLKTYELRY